MSNLPTRRGFLALAGSGTAAMLAGCSQLGSSDQSDDRSDDAVALRISPDEEEMQRLTEEIQADIEGGELGQQEAQLEYQKRRLELVEAAATSFEESASESEFTIEASETAYGLFRIDGSDEAILETLRDGTAGAIYPGDRYDRLVQQQKRQAQQREQRRALLEQQQSQNGSETNETTSGNESDTETESTSGNETDS